MTLSEKRDIGRYLRITFSNPRQIRYELDGSVTAYVDRMPNTNQPGRIFCGWATELLDDWKSLIGDWSPDE